MEGKIHFQSHGNKLYDNILCRRNLKLLELDNVAI
jgi:hypothetical protein